MVIFIFRIMIIYSNFYQFLVFTGSGSSYTQGPTLTANDGQAFDNFGGAISIYSGTAMLSAPAATVNGQNYQGAVYGKIHIGNNDYLF